jgi:hypothetical protein
MQVVHARAAVTTSETVDESLTTIVARSVLEAALKEDESAELWFDLANEDGEAAGRLSVDLAYTDIEELLRLSPGDEITLSLDGEELENLFADSDVEAHGLKGAVAIAVATAAILAPAGQAAVQQSIGAAATTQRANPAATTQIAAAATTTQIAAAATTQVSTAARTQVSGLHAKTQVSKTLVLKASGLKLLRSGLGQ